MVAEGANLEAARKAGLTPVELSTPAPRPAQAVDMAPANDVSTPVPSIQAAAVTTAPAPSDIAEPASSGKAAPSPNPMPEREAASATSAPAPTAFALLVGAGHHQAAALGPARLCAPHRPGGHRHGQPGRRGHRRRQRACTALRGKPWRARGDATARIFTTHLDAELLAVAGVYRVVEDKLDRSLHNQPALVRLDGDTLRIEALKA